jgi:hypothetical protein
VVDTNMGCWAGIVGTGGFGEEKIHAVPGKGAVGGGVPLGFRNVNAGGLPGAVPALVNVKSPWGVAAAPSGFWGVEANVNAGALAPPHELRATRTIMSLALHGLLGAVIPTLVGVNGFWEGEANVNVGAPIHGLLVKAEPPCAAIPSGFWEKAHGAVGGVMPLVSLHGLPALVQVKPPWFAGPSGFLRGGHMNALVLAPLNGLRAGPTLVGVKLPTPLGFWEAAHAVGGTV